MSEMLYRPEEERDSCGVGLITRKDGKQTHEIFRLADQALCKVPHRGGINAYGIGDGGGVNFDLSVRFYRKLTGNPALQAGEFAVGNFYFPRDKAICAAAEQFLRRCLTQHGLVIILERDVPVDTTVLNSASSKAQLPIKQWVVARPATIKDGESFEHTLTKILRELDEKGVNKQQYPGFYPLSFSSRTQVYKGLLNSWEVISYFKDLKDPDHEVSMLFFHTRFSTNTSPNPHYAQPFRRLAHNGELNTDRKNRISEQAVAAHHGNRLYFPPGQSDSARLDMTVTRRLAEEKLPIDRAILQMMPPAWENDKTLPPAIYDMLEYFSLSEEINDGPAGLVFSDGIRIGAALDRLGLRPLRTVQTIEYFAVFSEAGQVDFPPETVIQRGRIEAGGMMVYNQQTKTISYSRDILARMAAEKNYSQLLAAAKITPQDLPAKTITDVKDSCSLNFTGRHIAYSLNQESFRFMLDPMLKTGAERVSAMGYGLAVNGLTYAEGGMSRYFSQRFAQVTNPPLDSIREADGMSLRVVLGAKPLLVDRPTKSLVLPSPYLLPQDLASIRAAGISGMLSVGEVTALYDFKADEAKNALSLENALTQVCDQVIALVKAGKEIIILDDSMIDREHGALPAVLVIAAVNRRLIREGLRFHTGIIYHTGQICSTHDVALILGFGASAVSSATVYNRARELYTGDDVVHAMVMFKKALHKSLMKTMGKFGLCTVESYIGGGFFEPSFLNTEDPKLQPHFPDMKTPIGGAGFADIARSAWQWHQSALQHEDGKDVPLLGLFKERSEGAGHSYGQVAVRAYAEMTGEDIVFAEEGNSPEGERLNILPQDDGYLFQSHRKRTPEEIDSHVITQAYRHFIREITQERSKRPAALRDVLALPVDFRNARDSADFCRLLQSIHDANHVWAQRGLRIYSDSAKTAENSQHDAVVYRLILTEGDLTRHRALAAALQTCFGTSVQHIKAGAGEVLFQAYDEAVKFFQRGVNAPEEKPLADIQPAHEIIRTFATGAMSHGALLAKAHEAVAMGANMVGVLSNSGEGGEHSHRYGTIKASKIKQIASGRFGVWAGYLADPSLEELEIKIGQGAKPGEGGQLPARKVTVEIAAARGGTPGVELVSPPPHHDTYSIEDLGQLIHDAKAARVRVVVKLVSSEGIGTIAVGVAKAGADVINIAGNTGGTGAAQVTSLKNSGRIPEPGLAEVHQALAVNGLRERVILRCSGAHQTGLDVIKSALLGGDSFEFGTTALMMLKCVMAKNCNIKCPVGLTTDHEVFDGDPRALAQYFMNVAHEVREWLAYLGFASLRELRGRADLLHLINHPNLIGTYRMDRFLCFVPELKIDNPKYWQADFSVDDQLWDEFIQAFPRLAADEFLLLDAGILHNHHKSVGAQFALDIERYLMYTQDSMALAAHPKVLTLTDKRRVLRDDSVMISSENSAGQSYGAFNNSGITLVHQGTCNDGVGKSMSGGRIVVKNPGGGSTKAGCNVLVGNFALFGATGGELYIEGQAGDRFGVRNSGATAVVEGVGDFACEYMTNGAVVNLGNCGKGFANGMSGGVAYQYDPSGERIQRVSHDSAVVFPLTEDSELARGQEQALLYYLNRHFERTESVLAEQLLADWAHARQDFYFLIPTAWFTHHTAEAIMQANSRKDLQAELAKSLVGEQIRYLQKHYQNQSALFNGQIPQDGEHDRLLAADYAVVSGVLTLVMNEVKSRDIADIPQAARRLILNNDRALCDKVEKVVYQALADYSDTAIAALVADQRMCDYKRALSLRESFDSNALGTSVWIIERSLANRKILAQFEPLTQVLARRFIAIMTEALYQQQMQSL